jgi:hypothetical protein
MPSSPVPQTVEELLTNLLAGAGSWEFLLQLVIAILMASPLVLRVVKEHLPYIRERLALLLAEDAASAIRELFRGDLAALGVYDGCRYPWNRQESRGYAQRVADEQVLGVLQQATGAELKPLGSVSPEALIKEVGEGGNWSVLSLGSPIANVLVALAMGYDLEKPSAVKDPLPYMFDFSYVDYETPLVDKTWAELQKAGKQTLNLNRRPPNWRIVEIARDRAANADWTDLQNVSLHHYTPEPIDESDPLARFQKDYAIISRTKSRVRSGNDIIVAGCHGEGTIAASRALEDKMFLKRLRRHVNDEDEFQVLLKVSIQKPMPEVKKPLDEKWFQTEIVDIMKRTSEGWTSAG